MTQPLWQPSQSRIEKTNLWRFIQSVNATYDLNITEYHQLHQWSIDYSDLFWDQLWQQCDIKSSHKGNVILAGNTMPGAKWYPQATLNFAENLLKYRHQKSALIFCGENGAREEISYSALYHRVTVLVGGLKKYDIKPGDRIAGFMPNVIDCVVAMLATASLGAVWSSCSPDFGINGVLDRFGQIKPRILFTTDGYYYNGKTLNSLEKVSGIAGSLPSIEAIVVCNHVTQNADLSLLHEAVPNKAIHLNDFIDPQAAPIEFVACSFDDPLYIMYSSGTTGVPKCIVHGIGGTLLQHNKEHLLHTDVTPDDVLFYYTTCGWMMWNWLVSGLSLGCTVLLYDGSPFKTPDILIDIAQREKVSVFGTSAKYIAAIEKAGIKPNQSHDLTPLKTILSTGSPLSHESFDYVYRDVKQDVLLASISGGTDIVSCFALGCPILPVYRGELQCAGLGMAVKIFDDDGQAVSQTKGELVCTAPFPSMPIYFWQDDQGQKYHDAYFAQFDNVWAHGDYGEITRNQGVIIHGRSDAVLNPGGVRIGTAEIYRQVEVIEEVLESIVIGQNWHGDVRVILFVVLRQGLVLDGMLTKTIQQQVRANTTPRHVPAKVIQVEAIPRTISGKIVELAVRKVIHGEVVKNKAALANPEALDFFVNLPELLS
ncbi:MAG: acetoacetate--CoA ligase [Oceanospirillaceae bacterium]|nr:acetoacetate--CoA ligase [Oceanospirillaceae bacterium]